MMIFNTGDDRALGEEVRICGCAGVASGVALLRTSRPRRDLRVPESRGGNQFQSTLLTGSSTRSS